MHAIDHGDSDVQREAPSMSLFQGSSHFNIHNSSINQIHGDANLNHIHGNITVIRFGDEQFTQDQRNSIRDIISTHVALPDINHNLNRHLLTLLIINLPRAEAVFNDYQNEKKSGPCLEGTRVALLREMADWATDMDGSRMYILSGLAGIGKSTVAYTVASRAADLNLLGASFFFSRDEADRNNAKKLFTTIAYQLCVYDEVFAKAIGDALQTERGSAAPTKGPQEQLQALIIDPLRSIVRLHARPILVIIDALDECDEDDVHTVIMGLSQFVRDLPPFKVILTTRPNQYLDYFQDGHKLFHLQDIEDKVVDSDIRLYLQHSLSLEQVRKHFLKKKWCASDDEIDCLVHAAGRLFIIASTAVRYILDKFASNPAVQMQKLLRAFAQDHTPFKDLNYFYTVILRNIVPADCDDDDIVNRYQSVVGAIIFVQRPLHVSTLSHLIEMNEDDIHAVLDHLQSVILLGDDNVPRIYHKSFPDYLTDQARCKDAHLRIDPKVHHTQIASRCFDTVNKHLKYNILCLGKLARYMSNEDGLKEDGITDEQLEEKIPQQLRYACVYWANHVQVATIEDIDVMNGLLKFVDEHTMHWFEVLSLIGNLDSAYRALRVVLKLFSSTSSDLQLLLLDALRFISRFYELIKGSALHTYYSALPFSPTDSPLYRRFIKEVEDKICIVENGPKKWNALLACSWHEQGFYFIKFSQDSSLFYSCSKGYVTDTKHQDGKLKVWDAASGIPISTIPGQKFAVTNDFSTIASSNGNIITYYNTNGGERSTMFTTSSKIKELAISSDSGRIAAALADGTVWLWGSKNGELIGSFRDEYGSEFQGTLLAFMEQYSSRLQFSSTGTRLIYSSASGKTIKLRDGTSGRFIADLRCGSRHEFEFSGDGSRIVSLTPRGLALWSSESGALIGALRIESSLLAISENGSLLATANSRNVMLWSENQLNVIEINVMAITSMAFSPDKILAIGTKFYVKLYDVKTHSFVSEVRFSECSTVMAFSPDSARLAYGDNGWMYLLDIEGHDTSGPSSLEAANVTVIALSRDCSRVACGFITDILELWGTSHTMQRIASHKTSMLSVLKFEPDGRLFASGSFDGIIELWNSGDGTFYGTIQAPSELKAVALSNGMLCAAGMGNVTLWSLDSLSLIHVFQKSGEYSMSTVSISDDSDFAAVSYDRSIDLFDIVNRTIIATFKVPNRFHKLTFLPDKSHLVAQTDTGTFLSIKLINKCIINGPIFEHLIQLPDTPLWHGVPICPSHTGTGRRLSCFSALFSQHASPVPVLWIPTNLSAEKWAEGSSMIALGCTEGRKIVLLRLFTSGSHVSRPSKYRVL